MDYNIKPEKNNTGKILLTVLCVAILVVSIVGISFALFSATHTSGENTLTTGTITISYSEPGAGINVEDALPTHDSQGKISSDYFEFTVSTTASGVINIPYEINLTIANEKLPDGATALNDEEVRVYLTDGSDQQVVEPKLMSVVKTSESELRPGSYVLYTTTNEHDGTSNKKTITKTYRLRMWIYDEDEIPNDHDGVHKAYKLKVNVDSKVKPIGSN